MNSHLHNFQFATYARKYGLQPADCVKESIFQTGLSKHHAVYLGMDENGIEWISENQKFAGVRMVKASTFFDDNKSYTIIPFNGNYDARKQAVQRALQELGKPYDLIKYNCEHYSSYVQSGVAESSQVRNGVVAFIGLLLFAFVVSHE